jgi:hypothetical protein
MNDTPCYLDPAFRCGKRGFSLGFVCGDGGLTSHRRDRHHSRLRS